MKNILVISLLIIVSVGLIYYVFQSKRSSVADRITQTVTNIENIENTIAPKPTKILTSGVPDHYQINMAFVPQAPEQNWSLPWQDACEEAALLTVHYFYAGKTNPPISQIAADLDQMFSIENQLGYGINVSLEQMATVSAKLYPFSSKIIENPSILDIQRYISQNIPVIVPANGKILFRENKHFKNGGPWYHNIVVVGYDDNKKQFIVHDVGTQFGAYYRYSYSLLMQSIHDFPVGHPETDINLGIPRVLVLLK
jgi:hypothetical protein